MISVVVELLLRGACYNIQISNFLLIRVLHLDDNDVKTNYRRIFSTVSASTPFSTQIRFVFVII